MKKLRKKCPVCGRIVAIHKDRYNIHGRPKCPWSKRPAEPWRRQQLQRSSEP